MYRRSRLRFRHPRSCSSVHSDFGPKDRRALFRIPYVSGPAPPAERESSPLMRSGRQPRADGLVGQRLTWWLASPSISIAAHRPHGHWSSALGPAIARASLLSPVGGAPVTVAPASPCARGPRPSDSEFRVEPGAARHRAGRGGGSVLTIIRTERVRALSRLLSRWRCSVKSRS